MPRVCKTVCCRCGDKFDRFSGRLINISDEGLKEFYALPFIQEYIKQEGHSHPTLCASCLQHLLGRKLQFKDIKFKNGKWMTSNVAYLIMNSNHTSSYKEVLIEKLKQYDKAGILPFRNNPSETLQMREVLLK